MSDNDKLNINPHEIKKRGGKRPGAGRKVGSTTKVQSRSIMAAIESKVGMSWEEAFAENYALARLNGDQGLVAKYDHMMYHKYVPDRVDHTSNGETLKTAFSFAPVELPDWKKPE
jgi:hypothetical protein